MTTQIEVRCPAGPGRLLAVLRQSGQKPKRVDGNLLEIACPDCARLLRKTGTPVFRVLHRFNLIGECIETVRVYD